MADFTHDPKKFEEHQLVLADHKNFGATKHLSDAGFAQASSTGGNTSRIRPNFTRNHYEHFRTNEYIPEPDSQEDYHEIMRFCVNAYQSTGIIKSIFDFMSEFIAEGIEILHPDAGPAEFYKAWQERVRLEDRVERAANWCLKGGNFVVRGKYGTVDTRDVRKLSREIKNQNVNPALAAIRPGYIPLEYVFYDPSTIELVGDYVGALSDRKIYAVKVSGNILSMIRKQPSETIMEEVIAGVPDEIKELLKRENRKSGNSLGYYLIPLPQDKIFVGHYKKDDTEIWALPPHYSVLDDIIYMKKLKLAKTAGLDGWYNLLRIWKLGDHTKDMFPSPGAAAKLADILSQNSGGGAMDLIWDSMIDLHTEYPPVEKLQNFDENIEAILIGLGIPKILAGGSSEAGGFSSGTIGLKNFIKRLVAVRREIKRWLTREIAIINRNMGFKKMPYIRFANEDLQDERVYFTILKEMVDRNIISDQTVIERLGEIPEIEELRVKREEGLRDTGSRPNKASPFHNPQMEDQQDFEAEQNEVRMKEERRRAKEQGTNLNNESKKGPTKEKGAGRPKNSNDKLPRRRSPNRVKSAIGQYEALDKEITRALLDTYGLKNARQLTAEHKDILEQTRLYILPCIPPDSSVDANLVQSVYKKVDAERQERFNEFYYSIENIESASAEEKKIAKIMAYEYTWGDE